MAPRSKKRVAVSTATSAATSAVSSTYPSRASSPTRQPFRFWDLPSELRLRVYEEVLLSNEPLDLDSYNYRLILPRLTLFLVSHRMHEEAYRVFYSQPLRLFPHHDHGRFFYTKKPLLARLPPLYRKEVNTAVLMLGPGWSKPPMCQNTGPALGLADCESLRVLKVFVTCDPSDSTFNGFRGKGANEDTYKWFCLDLLSGIFEQVPSLETVEIDAYPGIKKDTPLLVALQRKVKEQQGRLRFVWGPLKRQEEVTTEPGVTGLETAMAGMGLGGNMPRVVEVSA